MLLQIDLQLLVYIFKLYLNNIFMPKMNEYVQHHYHQHEVA